MFLLCFLLFITFFAKWLNCQSPCNYLRGASKGTVSKRLMRVYWICTSIKVLIKCGLHRHSRARALTQLSGRTTDEGTAWTLKESGLKVQGERRGQWGEVGNVKCLVIGRRVFNQDGSMQRQGQRKRIKWGETTGERPIRVWLRSPAPSSGLGFNKDVWVIKTSTVNWNARVHVSVHLHFSFLVCF